MEANPINVSEMKVFDSVWIFLAFKNSAGRTCRRNGMKWHPGFGTLSISTASTAATATCRGFACQLASRACAGMTSRNGLEHKSASGRAFEAKFLWKRWKGILWFQEFRIIHVNTLIYTLQKRKIMIYHAFVFCRVSGNKEHKDMESCHIWTGGRRVSAK